MQHSKMDKVKLLDMMRMEHDFLLRTIAGLSDSMMTRDGVMEGWSIKDILAHITTWEQRFLRGMEKAQHGETVEWPEAGYSWDDLDRLNEHDFLDNKDRLLNDVLADFERSYAQMLDTVAATSPEVLCQPGKLNWTGKHALWQFIDANAGEHYREHAEAIREWLIGE